MNCAVCDKEFKPTKNQISCSDECKKIRKARKVKAYYENKKLEKQGLTERIERFENNLETAPQNSFLSRGLSR